jgi:membrane-associated protease RseP (regulator of RpoE activity)
VLAGPAMNLIFPIALYTSVYLEDEEFLPPTMGAVFPGKPAEGKLFAGDVITAIEGENKTRKAGQMAGFSLQRRSRSLAPREREGSLRQLFW